MSKLRDMEEEKNKRESTIFRVFGVKDKKELKKKKFHEKTFLTVLSELVGNGAYKNPKHTVDIAKFIADYAAEEFYK